MIVELSKGKQVSGYGITRRIKKDLGLSASPGTVYNQLHRLEKEGITKKQLVPRGTTYKAVYEATDAGRKTLKDFIDKWDPEALLRYVIAHAKKRKTPTQ